MDVQFSCPTLKQEKIIVKIHPIQFNTFKDKNHFDY